MMGALFANGFKYIAETSTTEWLQGQLSLSSFRGRSILYQELLGELVKNKLSPRSSSVALRVLNPIHKMGP